MSLAEKYKKSKENKSSLRFSTHHPNDTYLHGIVTHIQKHFIVLREHKAFTFDGVVALPKKVITGTRDKAVDQCATEILRYNGQIKNAKAPKWLDSCTTLKQILEMLQ